MTAYTETVSKLAEYIYRYTSEHDRILLVLDLVTIGPDRYTFREGVGPLEVRAAVGRLLDRLGSPSQDERRALERAYTVAFGERRIIRNRPLRAPHYSASAATLAGTRRPPRPGEVALAHAGVLFLENLDEFPKRSIEALAGVLNAGVDLGGFAARPWAVIGVYMRDDRTPPAAQERAEDRVREYVWMLGMQRIF